MEARQNTTSDPFLLADAWQKHAFDLIIAGKSVTREGSFQELHAVRHKFYRLRKAFVQSRQDDNSPETNYLKSAFAQLHGEVKTKGKCFLTIGQMPGLQEFNKTYEDSFWKDQMQQLQVEPADGLQNVLAGLEKPGK